MDNMSQHTYFLCDKCKRISRIIFINNDLTPNGICRCGLNNRVDQSDRLYELDQAIRSFGGMLIYHFPGYIEECNGQYLVNLPMMRYRDCNNMITDIIKLYSRCCDQKYDYTCSCTDTGLIDFSIIGSVLLISDKSKANLILSDYKRYFNAVMDQLISTLNAIVFARHEKRLREAKQPFEQIMGIKDIKKYYYCPVCHNMGYIKTDTHWSEKMVSQSGMFSGSVSISDPILTNHVRCIACDEYMVELDADIAPLIKAMNDHGIETIYCCQGHYEAEHSFQLPRDDDNNSYDISYHSSLPYVTFYANKCDNKDLIDIVTGAASNTDKYPHIKVQFIDEDHNESDEYDRIYIYADMDEISEELLNTVKAEFIKFLEDFIERYGNHK